MSDSPKSPKRVANARRQERGAGGKFAGPVRPAAAGEPVPAEPVEPPASGDDVDVVSYTQPEPTVKPPAKQRKRGTASRKKTTASRRTAAPASGDDTGDPPPAPKPPREQRKLGFFDGLAAPLGGRG